MLMAGNYEIFSRMAIVDRHGGQTPTYFFSNSV